MRFLGRLFIAGLMLLALARACTAEPAPVTAQLKIDEATCSGTVIAPTVILSAAHCFKDDDEDDPIAKLLGHAVAAPLPTSMTVDGYKVYIETIVFDDSDHAMVKVIFTFKDHATLAHELPPVGGKVHYWGNPNKESNVYREGYVTKYAKGEMLMDVNGYFGDSGAGIFDASGKVVAVMSYIQVPHRGFMTFKLMGAYPLDFTPMQYSMMGVEAP